ncbi:hypothetical protein KEM48_007374 [Puccinia striiformis f. sp. tritici PST-130]|nr:hypothetical protein KEM48_007374 [Puccinia striiformis f. sp. tritici PST-130]
MKATVTVLLAALSLSEVMTGAAATNSQCYDHFLRTDHCVVAAANEQQRCGANNHHGKLLEGVQLMTMQTTTEKRSLVRRYDTTIPASTDAHVAFRCPIPKNPDSSWDNTACLWSGSGSGKVGWVDQGFAKNCGKKIWIQKQGQKGTVQYARISGGCEFRPNNIDESVGCFNLAVNQKVFDGFNPTTEEKNNHRLKGILSWDFNNPNGKTPWTAKITMI